MNEIDELFAQVFLLLLGLFIELGIPAFFDTEKVKKIVRLLGLAIILLVIVWWGYGKQKILQEEVENKPVNSNTETVSLQEYEDESTVMPVIDTVQNSTPLPDLVSFGSSNDPTTLNPLLGWQQGGSDANGYNLTLKPGSLVLISGPGVRHWDNTSTAPLILYPFEGNFESQVKLVFLPTSSRDCQYAGLGIRSAQDPFNWLRLGLRQCDRPKQVAVQGDSGGNGLEIGQDAWPDFPEDTVYLKIERNGSLYTFSYSSTGVNWVILQENYVFSLTDKVEIFLVTVARTNSGITAEFSDFIVSQK